jgi:hypothetical protein
MARAEVLGSSSRHARASWQEERGKAWLGDAAMIPRDGFSPAACAEGGWRFLQQDLPKILPKTDMHICIPSPFLPSTREQGSTVALLVRSTRERGGWQRGH